VTEIFFSRQSVLIQIVAKPSLHFVQGNVSPGWRHTQFPGKWSETSSLSSDHL